MKKLLFFLLLLPSIVRGQATPGKHLLKGTAHTDGSGTMPYLVSIDVHGKTVSGYSITDYTNNSMKASVVGSIDAKGNLHIQETGSMDGPSVGNMVYYYFTANLKLTIRDGKRIYSGPFISRKVSGEVEDQGTMVLIDNVPPAPMLKPIAVTGPVIPVKPKPEPKPKPKPPVAESPKPKPKPPVVDTVKPKPVVITPPPQPQIDTEGYFPLYHWQSDSVKFEIWDGYKEDGDGVGITFNGKPIADYLVLSIHKSYFILPIERGKINELRIDLRNEGTEPPNTPFITLHDNEHDIPLSISGKEGTKASLYFIKP